MVILMVTIMMTMIVMLVVYDEYDVDSGVSYCHVSLTVHVPTYERAG